jgi:hypothetical protein
MGIHLSVNSRIRNDPQRYTSPASIPAPNSIDYPRRPNREKTGS